jgi:copper(I)-binding protein
MLLGLNRDLKTGDTFSLTLLYEKGGAETVQVVVIPEN